MGVGGLSFDESARHAMTKISRAYVYIALYKLPGNYKLFQDIFKGITDTEIKLTKKYKKRYGHIMRNIIHNTWSWSLKMSYLARQ